MPSDVIAYKDLTAREDGREIAALFELNETGIRAGSVANPSDKVWHWVTVIEADQEVHDLIQSAGWELVEDQDKWIDEPVEIDLSSMPELEVS